MLKSKVIDIILKLSERERDELSEFLNTPYFNKKKKISEIYSIIVKNSDNLFREDITEETLFKPLFEMNKYSYSFVRNLMSELLQLTEMFLVVNSIKKNTSVNNHYNSILLREYNSRYLDNLFKLKIKKISELYKDRKIDHEYFDFLGRLEAENIAYHLYRSEMKHVPGHLISRSEYDLCYILLLLEFDINDLNVNMASFNLNLEKEVLPEFVRQINFGKFLLNLDKIHSPVRFEIEMRIRLIMLSVNKEDTGNYFILKNIIYNNLNRYRNGELSNLFIKLKNYCAYRIYSGDIVFYNEKYSLLKKELQTVKYNSEGVGPLYINIYLEAVQNAVNANDTEFALKVISDFTKELEMSKRDSVSYLAKAIVEFRLGNFDKTFEHLSKVEPVNIYIKNLCKILYIKLFYETESFETGLSSLDSFSHYINETKELTPDRKKNLKKNYDILRKLYKMKTSPSKFSVFHLKEFTDRIKDSGVNYIEWYIEKAEQLHKIIK
ncbi:MAG TPA: hypothetical protein PK536_10540 [Ignavibacteria bacterium]|nr:hypothetical protein [Bacteroidota bacterium]HRI85869.1 hypothetical protein [Ignavibacteria bacterium]HRJ98696.1 hypothetical protein [Ignavibacteria bacterium]